jgi:hypothetical protein
MLFSPLFDLTQIPLSLARQIAPSLFTANLMPPRRFPPPRSFAQHAMTMFFPFVGDACVRSMGLKLPNLRSELVSTRLARPTFA